MSNMKKKIIDIIQGSDPFAEMLIINYGNVTLATGIENIDKEQVMPYNSYIRIHPFTR